MRAFLYVFFGETPDWVLTVGISIGVLIGLFLTWMTMVVQKKEHDKDPDTIVETAALLAFSFVFWMVLGVAVSCFVALSIYAWPLLTIGTILFLVVVGRVIYRWVDRKLEGPNFS